MNELELSYAAGIIDGEGYIGVQNKWSRNNYQLRVAVAMKYDIIPNWLYERFEGSVTTYLNAGKSLTMWVVSGQLARSCCEQVLPYLLLKNEQAEAALDYPVNPRGVHLSDAQKADRENIYNVMKELNH